MIFSEQFNTSLSIAFEALKSNGLRSFLTALGVIFGVAAVIAMMAVGNGTQQEILNQIELVGVNNIVIKPIHGSDKDGGELKEDENSKESAKKWSPGLTLQDAESIMAVFPSVKDISPEVVEEVSLVRGGKSAQGRLVGIEPYFFNIGNFDLEKGKFFNKDQRINGEQVCIIGHDVKTLFFSREEPIGKYIKCGPLWLKIVGVLAEKKINEKSISDLGIRNFNTDIYTPIRTVLIRYKNRSKIQPSDLGDDDDEENQKETNYHQIDRLTVKVGRTEELSATAEAISRMLERRHFEVQDYEIVVPELLLQQQQNVKNIFKWVLIFIAFLSLLIGGIGIMNIMLASVLERIKEIGLRQALGARKMDIVIQFLLEAVLLSFSGGIIGIILGVLIAFSVTEVAGIPAIISVGSIVVSFLVSIFIGVLFGILPAIRASERSPINSLRHE